MSAYRQILADATYERWQSRKPEPKAFQFTLATVVDHDEEDEYREGASPWGEVADHDSCWREGVERVLRQHDGDALSLQSSLTGGAFWSLVDPPGSGAP